MISNRQDKQIECNAQTRDDTQPDKQPTLKIEVEDIFTLLVQKVWLCLKHEECMGKSEEGMWNEELIE